MMKPSKTGLASLGLLCGLSFVLAACPATLDDRCSEGACIAASGEGGLDADGGTDAPTDPCIDNPTDAKCLDESTSLFVSKASGNDQDPAAGTRDKPLKSLGAALTKIDQAKRRIYVCEGTYPEDITLNASHSSVSIFGGVDCTWNAAPAVKPVVGASANPFRVDGTAGLAIADLTIQAANATSGSSIALLINGGDTTLRRVRLSAGKGADGDNAVVTPFANFPSQTDLNGNSAPDGTTGGAEKPYTCPGNLMTKGGTGGNIGNPGAVGTPGPANGGLVSNCSGTVDGQPGANSPKAAGAVKSGELRGDGWLAEAGKNGEPGEPGQGGGGGYGNMGAGGGGGAGGCGGAGGPAGKGGGASIALASYLAKVIVDTSILEAKDAGNGGKGSIGQDGQTIFGFRGTGSGNACNGGSGGPGGKGGAGGGGAGGSSLGLAYKGTKPTIDSTTAASVSVGKKGMGGQLVGTNSGSDGANAKELSLD